MLLNHDQHAGFVLVRCKVIAAEAQEGALQQR